MSRSPIEMARPTNLDDGPEGLSDGERLMLDLLRAWAAARRLGEDPRQRLGAAGGADASSRGAAFFIMVMTAIEEHVRRPLRIAPPGCRGYACDEQRLITACGVSPAAPDVAEGLLDELVFAPKLVAVLLRAMNGSLVRQGLHLPMRLSDPTSRQIAPARPTLH